MAIIDANVAVGLILALPWSEEAREEIRNHAERLAPSIFVAELTNAVWQNVRAGNLTVEAGATSLDEVLPIVELSADSALAEPALRLAAAENHPVYDCLYLALAKQRRQVLITADRKLAALARRIGVAVKLLL
jgi:predicted nucleic acid-binding protein